MRPAVEFVFVALAAFLCGSIPFSVWLGRLFTRKDVRDYGDGNPGAINVFRSGSAVLGVVVLLLDVTKGVLPVALAVDPGGFSGWQLAVIAILPVAGHAFSPFLRFRGGKAIAVTLGTWIGLMAWGVVFIGVTVVTVARFVVRHDARAVVLALIAMAVGIAVFTPDMWLGVVLAGQFAIIVWKHRAAFTEPPRPRRTPQRPATPGTG